MRLRPGILLALMAVVFSCSAPSGGTGGAAVDNQAEAILYGGREKVLLRWSGRPSGVEKVRLEASDGTRYEAETPWETGETLVSGVPEGEARFALTWIGPHTETAGPVLATFVFGPRYEAGLKPWTLDAARFVATTFRATFSRSVPGRVYGEEFAWDAPDGLPHDSLYVCRHDGTAETVTLRNVGARVRHRSFYVLSQETGDRFYTGWSDLEPSAPAEPLPEQVCGVGGGYRGIWFTLGQVKTEYGDKYSGGLSTYTMKHIPMAVYAPEVDRTYFVYGGTPSATQKYLQCMIGCYDHATGRLQKPRVVMDKGKDGVKDPHDDPTVQIDKDGYIWVFVAGRSTKRHGVRYRSVNPYDITAFEYVNEDFMAYPQVFYDNDKGFFLFFTRYDGVRQLFFQTSADGRTWTPYRQLASIKEGDERKSGHYQISNMWGTKLCTAFNRHINGNVDTRTNIYFVQSTDWGKTWTTVDGQPVDLPITTRYNNALVRDYQALGKNCYIKDVNFDRQGNPIILYLISDSYLTGPQGGIREWFTLAWNGTKWDQTKVTESTHCYDSGSLWVDGNEWTILAPTAAGPQYWGAGGEVERWRSTDHGRTWTLVQALTHDSTYNHTYMRRPQQAADGFYAFWADGHPDLFSPSCLYFCDRAGDVYRMPYQMTDEWQSPERVY